MGVVTVREGGHDFSGLDWHLVRFSIAVIYYVLGLSGGREVNKEDRLVEVNKGGRSLMPPLS